ncbi:right-handed parallel beta-helix repeat-containing protein [Cytobacillus firmus]|uniref:right-handed parallel beta-helix repeat-containing protein n=1 Tax=Cytobacillus firmus TaxID=1399 RepID=UPI00384B31D9
MLKITAKRTLGLLFFFIIVLLMILNQAPSPDIITPEEFGADGFDKKPDTTALQKALDTGADAVQLKEGATYYIDQTLTAQKSIKIFSGKKKANIIQLSENEKVLVFKNRAKSMTKVAEDITKGNLSIAAESAEDAQPGDIIELKSDRLWHWDHRNTLTKGEIHTVENVSGNKIHLSSKTNDSYSISKDENVTIKLYSPKTIHIENIRFSYSKPVTNTAIVIEPTIDSTFKNLNISKAKQTGIKLIKNINARVEKSFFSLHTDKKIAMGYGFQDYGGRGTTISNSTFEKVRRGIDFSGDIPSRFGRAANNRAYGPEKGTLAAGNSGFGTHSTAEYITFEDNYAENFDYHFVSRGNHITFKDNSGTGNARAFLHVTHGDNVTLENNSYTSTEGSKLEYFILKGTRFDGNIIQDGNTGAYQVFER